MFGGERVLSTCLQITERVNINHDWFVVVQVSFKDLLSADSACCIAASFKLADFKSSNFFGFLGKVVTGTWSKSDDFDTSLDKAYVMLLPKWLGVLLPMTCVVIRSVLVLPCDTLDIDGLVAAAAGLMIPFRSLFNSLCVFNLTVVVAPLAGSDCSSRWGTLVLSTV